MCYAFLNLQWGLGFAIAALFPRLPDSDIIFSFACPQYGYLIFICWFGITMVIVPCLRLIRESRLFHGEEVFHISPGSDQVRIMSCPRLWVVRHVARTGIALTGFAYAEPDITWTRSFRQENSITVP